MQIWSTVIVVGAIGCQPAVVAVPATQAAPPTAPLLAVSSDPLTMRLTVEQAEGPSPRQGERLRVTVENASEGWVWFRSDLGLGPPSSGSALWAEVSNAETGKGAEWSCRVKSLPPGEPEYLAMAPGTRPSVIISLHCYEFPSHGMVKVRVKFRDLETQPRRAPFPDLVWFRGELSSNMLEIVAREVPPASP